MHQAYELIAFRSLLLISTRHHDAAAMQILHELEEY